MARLYNAFDALGIGDAINRNQQRKLQNSMAINKLFADSFGNMAQGAKDWKDNKDMADAAETLASTYGIESAGDLRGSLGDADFAKFVTGRIDETDRENRQNGEWDRRYGKTRSDKYEDAGFGLVKDLLLANMASATGAIPTKMDLQKQQQIRDIANGFINNNNESAYTPILKQFLGNGQDVSGEALTPKTMADYYDEVSSLLKQEEDGKFSISLDDLKDYRTDRVNDKTWDQLAADKSFMNILRQNAAWLTDDAENIRAAFPELGDVYTYNEAERDIMKNVEAEARRKQKEAKEDKLAETRQAQAEESLKGTKAANKRSAIDWKQKQDDRKNKEAEEDKQKRLNSIKRKTGKNIVVNDITDEELEDLWDSDQGLRTRLEALYKGRLKALGKLSY